MSVSWFQWLVGVCVWLLSQRRLPIYYGCSEIDDVFLISLYGGNNQLMDMCDAARWEMDILKIKSYM